MRSIPGFQKLMFVVLLATSVSAAPARKGTIKTIEANGELIDCIDIYKQPALDHPLLKNHNIQLKPSWYLEDQVSGSNEGKKSEESTLHQHWTKYGECPDGTIPVLRNSRTRGLSFPGDDFLQDILGRNHSNRINDETPAATPTHEYAMTYLEKGPFYGQRSILNLWKPEVSADKEMSLSTARLISSGGVDKVDRVEAGWMVTSANKPVFYIYWTAYGSKEIGGCFNLDCPGFVQVDHKYVLGLEILGMSSYALDQHEVEITIVKDKFTGDWWLTAFGVNWGYWPGALFTNLNNGANYLFWGGEVINSSPMGSHTRTKMGSGHFSSMGYSRACYTRHLGYYNQDQTIIFLDKPEKLQPYVTKNKCYDINVNKYTKSNLGLHFFFGGPGYSNQCRI